MLEFGIKPPLSYKDFLSHCKEQLYSRDIGIIKRATTAPREDIKDPSPSLEEWKRFDNTLRNELAKARAIRKSKDPAGYIRGEYWTDPFIASFVHWVVNQDSPLEAEISLDRFRWEKIEDLAKGHYFDIDYLVTYALKLQILERWQRISSGRGPEFLQELVSA